VEEACIKRTAKRDSIRADPDHQDSSKALMMKYLKEDLL